MPVPHSGIDATTVARARAAISDNVRPAKADGRLWSLAGGSAGRPKVYHYLVCSTYSDSGAATCEHTRCHRAGETEERVAEFVLGLLRDPEVLREEAER